MATPFQRTSPMMSIEKHRTLARELVGSYPESRFLGDWVVCRRTEKLQLTDSTETASRKFKSAESGSRILKTQVPGRTSQIDPKPRLRQQAGQNQQVEAGDREVHVLLEVRPALPGAATEAEDSLEHRDTTFDTGPETSQLPVDPTGAHHLIDLQSAFLGKGDILDPLLLGPGEIGATGKTSVATDLSRPAAVQILLAPEPGLELSGVVGVPPNHFGIQNQAGDSSGHEQLVSEDGIPTLLLDDVGVLLEQGKDLLGGRNLLPPQDPTLGLIDDLCGQVQVMAQFFNDEPTGKILEPVRLLQGHLGVVGGLASDLQQVPVGPLATLAPVVDDVQMTSLGPALVIVKEDLVMTGQTAQPPGEDSNRIGQQLGVLRVADGAFHGRGVNSDLAAPFQPLPVGPTDQEPVDLLPGGGLDAADVLLEAGGAGSPVKGQTGEAMKAPAFAQVERQLGVGELVPVFEEGGAQNLLGRETGSPLP